MLNLTRYDDFVNENISNVFMLMKTFNITYVKYIREQSKRKGIKNKTVNAAFYKGFIIAQSPYMRDFIIDVLKFIRQYKPKTERYIEYCLEEAKKLYPKATTQYYPTPTAEQIKERLWQARHVPHFYFSKRDPVSLCTIGFSYDRYMGYIDVKLKSFESFEPDNVLRVRDVEDQFYKDEEYKVGDLKFLKSTIDNILPIKIQEWTEKIQKNFSEINNCPEHILKHIHGDKTIKWKNIGLFGD